MKSNGKVVPRSNLRTLKLEERENPAHIEPRRKFTESCETVLGPKATLGNFTPDKVTLEWDLYKDEDGQEGTTDATLVEIEPTPEAKHNYINANIMLPRGSEISRGQVTGCKCDIYGNTDGRATENPILDTQEYTI